jgi:hypothetical protein
MTDNERKREQLRSKAATRIKNLQRMNGGKRAMDDETMQMIGDYCRSKGMDEGSISELFSMLPSRQAIKGEPYERGTQDEGEETGHQKRLEDRMNTRESATNLKPSIALRRAGRKCPTAFNPRTAT